MVNSRPKTHPILSLRNLVPPLAASGRLRRRPTSIIAVVAGPNPSFSYYLSPRLDAETMPVRTLDLGTIPSGRELRDAFVVFCRYTSGAWMRAIEAHAGDIAGVGLFVDDDID